MNLSKPRGDLTVLEASIVRAVLGDELGPSSAASSSLSIPRIRDGEELQTQNQIPSLVADGSTIDRSTVRATDSSLQEGTDSFSKDRSSGHTVTSALTCDDTTSRLHDTVDCSVTIKSSSGCSTGASVDLQNGIDHTVNTAERNSVSIREWTSGLKSGRHQNGNYEQEQKEREWGKEQKEREKEQIEAKRCLGLLTPEACFAFASSRKKRRRDEDQNDCIEEDEERAEECGSYVKIRPNEGATANSFSGTGDDVWCTESDIDRKNRKSSSLHSDGQDQDMDSMAATMGFSSFKNNYKS
jgi:hypothetical protein